MEDLQPPTPAATADNDDHLSPSDYYCYTDSNCSTPYVSAPSSPGRPFAAAAATATAGYFYSAPASPMHFVLSTAALRSSGYVPSPAEASEASGSRSSEFEFSARFPVSSNDDSAAAAEIGSMSSADELFLNGQIRPMKLSTHLQRPQILAPLIDIAETEDDGGDWSNEKEDEDFERSGDLFQRSRDLRLRDKSLRRRTRSLSPLRNTASFDWCELVGEREEEDVEDRHRLGQRPKIMLNDQQRGDGDGESNFKGAGDQTVSNETTPSASASSSRCSSAGRSSKRWVFLKDFLRSKSEGRSNHKFWTNISFSPAKEKRNSISRPANHPKDEVNVGDPLPEMQKSGKKVGKGAVKKSAKPANGVGKRRVPPSAHELHYTANRAQAEELRKKTFLPYRQGLLGCLGFSSKSYGAMNGFARALNPVSSR